MNDAQKMVKAFHEKFGQASPSEFVKLANWPEVLKRFRLDLIHEELDELERAVAVNDDIEAIDACIDILYVVYGFLVSYGLDAEGFFSEVHSSNMTKIGGPIRSDGKILKGPNYRPPDIAGVLRRQS